MDHHVIYRKMLAAGISTVMLECGVEFTDKHVLGSLTELLQSYIQQIGFLTKHFAELAGRNEPIVGDVVLALVECGINVSSIENFMRRHKFAPLPMLHQQAPPKQMSMLAAGTKQPLPSHVPQHYIQLPDPHAYVRTPTHKQPIIDYESVREKAAAQKKDVEKALSKFLSKTSATHNLFDTDEANIFPLIACKPTYPPYLSALMPQDQIFDAEDLENDHKSQMMQQAKEQQKKEANKNSNKDGDSGDVKDDSIGDNESNKNDSPNSTIIDNPYLAATKMPKRDDAEITITL